MKTLGRVLMILTAFALEMGLTYVVVNAGGTSTNRTPQFENGGRQFPANGQFQPGERPEGHREGGGRGGGGLVSLMFGFVKNIVIIGVFVALIAVPRSLMRNRKRSMPAVAE